MRFKRATTIALSCVTTVCAAIGTVAYIKSEAEPSLTPQTAVVTATGNEAYFVGKAESEVGYGSINKGEFIT